MFLTLGITNVNAATLKLKLQNGTVKSYEIAESEYSLTIKDFKEKVAKELGIDADHQVYTGIDGYAVFNTNHFSIYTLAEKSGNSLTNEVINPQTEDKLLSYITMASLALSGLILVSFKLKKYN